MTRIVSIAHGEQGTRETLRIMAGLVREASDDRTFQVFVSQYFAGLSSGEVDSLVRRNYTYLDEQIETLYSPLFNMEQFRNNRDIVGDCDDVSMFLASVNRVLGYPVRFVAMRVKKNVVDFNHVVVEVYDNERWKRYDPTVMQGLIQIDYGQMVEYV